MRRTILQSEPASAVFEVWRGAVPSWLAIAILGLALGGVLGVAVVAASPAYVVGGLIGLVAILVVFSDVRYGLIGLIGVVTLLPFVVVPVPIGVVKLTLVDLGVSSILLIWLLRLLSDRAFSFKSSGIDLPVVLFLGVCLTSFVLGTSYMETAADARLFVKLFMAIILLFAVVGCVGDVTTLRTLVTCLAAGGSIAGGIAIWLYYLPAATATQLLAGLSRFGYPETDILQYDANTKVLKAIGTSIDHNILGATLMMCGAIAVGLIVAPETGRRRPWLVAGLAVTIVALLLTYSRGSLFGFLVGCAVIATLRYRKLWLVAGIIVVAIALIPQLAQSSFLTHVETGLAVQDQATQMRFGEYKDAFRLILAYPIFGVGFGSAP
ncbi:MAG TPA: O-antigen ligase family protein, partial [Chloroflexota bacterium]|nr:O-antigen ligase family protein [Chloroflexota bacterium]